MRVEIAKEEDGEEWDKLVEASPHSTIFHTWKWLKIMEKYSWMKTVMKKRVKCKLYPVIGLKGEMPIGVFPLFLYNFSLFRMVASPPSKVEVYYLGHVLVDYDKSKQDKDKDKKRINTHGILEKSGRVHGVKTQSRLYIYKNAS